MRTKVTLVLLFLNVALFFYIFQFESARPVDTKGKRVYGPEVAAIDSLTREGRTGPTMRVEKRGETWWLTRPYEWPANANAIAGILSELQHLEHETSFAVTDLAKSGQSLADYGLADPAITLTFTAAGHSYVTKIGDDTKIGNRLYLLSPDGSRIHVVGRSLADTIDLPLDKLRSESIFSIPVFEVRSLSLQSAPPDNLKVRLRLEGDRWSFETPILARANKAAVEVTINALNALKIGRILEARETDLDRSGLSAPALRLTMEGNRRREILLLGAPVPTTTPKTPADPAAAVEYYAKIEDKPVIFTTTVAPALLNVLRGAQETLRDTRILDFDPHAVTSVSIATPGQPGIELQRLEASQGKESWLLVARSPGNQAPQPVNADAELVADLFQKLGALNAVKFLSDAPSAADLENYGFNRPERVVTLNLSSGGGPRGTDPSTLVLQVGIKPEEHSTAYARLTSAPFVYQINPEILDLTPSDPLHFRQRLLRELPEGAFLAGMALVETGPAGATVYSHQLAVNESWEAALAPEPEARRKALTALLTQTRTLRAQKFVSDSFNPDHAEFQGANVPWKYRIDLTLKLTTGNGPAQTTVSTLFLTDRLGGTTQLAGSAEFRGGVTFTVTQEMLDALFALTYGEKHDPGPPPAAPAAPKPEQETPK